MECSLFAQFFAAFPSSKGAQAAFVVGISILSWVILLHCSHSAREMGPPSWPVLGMFPSVFLRLHEIYEWSSEMVIQCGGTFDFKPPWIHSDGRTSIFDDLMGNGNLNVDCQQWVKARKMMSSIIHSQGYKDHLIHTLEEVVKRRLMPAAEAACESGAVVDIQRLLVRLVGFGDFGIGGTEMDAIAEAFEQAMEATIHRFIVPSSLWKATRMLGVGREGKLKASLQVIHEFVHRLISTKLKELLVGDVPRHDLVSKLMQMDEAISDKKLRDTCISFVLVGIDTSSVALLWFFWMLIQRPIVQENILLEIQGVLERRPSGEEKHHDLRVEEVKEMQYLHAALSESLRLYPPLPINFKEVKEEEVLPDGRRLKKGASLTFSIYGIGRAESVWGNDWKQFKTARWLKEGVFMEEKYASKYPVFNAGPRICLGKDFPYLQMNWVAALLIYRYRLEVVKDAVI